MRQTPLKRTQWKRSKTNLPRSKPKARNKALPHGFPEPVRMAARLRSKGVCEVGSSACTGHAAEFHHRKLRRHGDHTLPNCLYACKACHGFIHANVGLSYMMGWLVKSFMDPALIPSKGGDRYITYHRTQH